MPVVGEQQELQEGLHPPAGGRTRPAEQAGGSDPFPLDAQLHVLRDGQLPVDAYQLEGAGQAQAGHLVGPAPGNVGAVEPDRTGVEARNPAQAVEQGGLPAAVGTDEPHHLAGVDADVHPIHRGEAAEALHHTAGFQQGGHGSFPGSVSNGLRPSHRRPMSVTDVAPRVDDPYQASREEQDYRDQEHPLRDEVVVEKVGPQHLAQPEQHGGSHDRPRHRSQTAQHGAHHRVDRSDLHEGDVGVDEGVLVGPQPPEQPVENPAKLKTVTLRRVVLIPRISAPTSSSRMATRADPKRVLRSHQVKATSPATSASWM